MNVKCWSKNFHKPFNTEQKKGMACRLRVSATPSRTTLLKGISHRRVLTKRSCATCEIEMNIKEGWKNLSNSLEINRLEDWYKVSARDIIEKGGMKYLQYFGNSLSFALKN